MDFVLLRGANYGRYLAVSLKMAPPGHRGRRAVQRDYDEPELNAIMWRPIGLLTDSPSTTTTKLKTPTSSCATGTTATIAPTAGTAAGTPGSPSTTTTA